MDTNVTSVAMDVLRRYPNGPEFIPPQWTLGGELRMFHTASFPAIAIIRVSLSVATCYSMIPRMGCAQARSMNGVHQLMVFAEAGVKLLNGQKPKGYSDRGLDPDVEHFDRFASDPQLSENRVTVLLFQASCMAVHTCFIPTCHSRTAKRLIAATSAIFLRFGFLSARRRYKSRSPSWFCTRLQAA